MAQNAPPLEFRVPLLRPFLGPRSSSPEQLTLFCFFCSSRPGLHGSGVLAPCALALCGPSSGATIKGYN
eukprot:1450655-Alexandrium_andersonii.AAC.1